MSSDGSNAYDDFAWIYNRHWGMKFTPKAVAVLDELILTGLPDGFSILDLCCGTGNLAAALAERGYQVTGIDGSSEILRYARKNAPGLEFIEAPATDFHLLPEFDLVTSFFDSLNHVLSATDLLAVFRNVRACLKPGGFFIFDMNTEQGFLNQWQGQFGIAEDDHVCLFTQTWDAGEKLAEFQADIFRLQGEEWTRSQVTLYEKSYRPEEIKKLLEEAGFEVKDVFGWSVEAGRGDLSEETDRMFFLCRF